jgi:hypothetical protein
LQPSGIEYAVMMIGANDQFFDGNNAYEWCWPALLRWLFL